MVLNPRVNRDPLLQEILSKSSTIMERNKYWVLHPHSMMQGKSVWLSYLKKEVGISSKQAIWWLLPLFGPHVEGQRIAQVYELDDSPIQELGKIPVTKFIRYLYFKHQLSPDRITQILVDKMGYSYASARPMLCRMQASEGVHRTRWEKDQANTQALDNMERLFRGTYALR